MGKKIEIGREEKIMLLKVLKNGYFDLQDIDTLVNYIYGKLTDKELDERIRELHRKLGMDEPPRILTKQEANEYVLQLEKDY